MFLKTLYHQKLFSEIAQFHSILVNYILHLKRRQKLAIQPLMQKRKYEVYS